jgi:hypothetical protein
MCVEQFGPEQTGTFDPLRCPLLQGLDPVRRQLLMETDPRIRACIGAITEGTTADLEPCVAKMVKAHEKRGAKIRGGRNRVV